MDGDDDDGGEIITETRWKGDGYLRDVILLCLGWMGGWSVGDAWSRVGAWRACREWELALLLQHTPTLDNLQRATFIESSVSSRFLVHKWSDSSRLRPSFIVRLFLTTTVAQPTLLATIRNHLPVTSIICRKTKIQPIGSNHAPCT